jgi:hypothetical protein
MCAQHRNVHIKVSNTDLKFMRNILLVLIVAPDSEANKSVHNLPGPAT